MTEFDAFLDNCDAKPDADATAFTDARHGIVALRDYGFALIEGPDALKFLQGQATCDSTTLATTSAKPGALCNLKGRIYASFIAGLATPESLLLRMSADIVVSTVAALGKYIVFSKAEICAASDRYAVLGVFGERAGHVIAQWFGTAPDKPFAAVTKNGAMAVQRDAAGQRFECWLPPAAAINFWQRASETLPASNAPTWHLQDIRSGIADVCANTCDEFLPQMLNMQVTGGVSFSKGCYTGQEVVARMQYRGKVKRRMYRARAETPAPIPGSAILDDSEQRCGAVVAAVNTADGGSEILAVIARDKYATARCEDGSPLQILDLPYAVED